MPKKVQIYYFSALFDCFVKTTASGHQSSFRMHAQKKGVAVQRLRDLDVG
jgi:hypothetical protein